MSGADITIGMKIEDYRVRAALEAAPKIFADEIDHWYNKERRAFLGTKSGSGSWGLKARLAKKPVFGHPEDGGWAPQVLGQFKSFKKNKDTLHPEMTMEFAPESPLEKAMEILEKGGTVDSQKFMPIPNWTNLKAAGYTGKFYFAFKALAESGKLFPVKQGSDTLLWFMMIGGRKLLMFTGKKHIRIHKQFTFRDAWERKYPAVMDRGLQAIDRAVRRTENTMAHGYMVE